MPMKSWNYRYRRIYVHYSHSPVFHSKVSIERIEQFNFIFNWWMRSKDVNSEALKEPLKIRAKEIRWISATLCKWLRLNLSKDFSRMVIPYFTIDLSIGIVKTLRKIILNYYKKRYSKIIIQLFGCVLYVSCYLSSMGYTLQTRCHVSSILCWSYTFMCLVWFLSKKRDTFKTLFREVLSQFCW